MRLHVERHAAAWWVSVGAVLLLLACADAKPSARVGVLPRDTTASTAAIREEPHAAPADTFAIITDSMAAVARARGTLLPSIAPHFDRGIVLARGGVTCYRYQRFTVVWRPVSDGAENDVLVRPATPDASAATTCTTDSLPGDFVVHEQDRMVGIRGDTLWSESGDAISDLELYDVTHRRRLIHLPGYEITRWRDQDSPELWIFADSATRAQCPRVPEGMYPQKDSLYVLHLASLRLEATGAERCRAGQ